MTLMHKLTRRFFIVVFFIFQYSPLVFSTPLNTDEQGLFAKGFDLVSYFKGKPVRGDSSISTTYQDAIFHFSTEENRSTFINNPSSYMPSFGGYCSYGVRHGKKFDINPDTYAIQNGKLYLLLNGATKILWEEDQRLNISIAEKNWGDIKFISASELDSQ